jgi:uncharacterized protein YcaQ
VPAGRIAGVAPSSSAPSRRAPSGRAVRGEHAPVERLTRAQARRIALAAQGFGVPRPDGPVTMRHVQGVLDRIAVLQIDSVNVVSRSHYVPVFSRLGPYDRSLLDRAASRPPRRVVEYWAHEASYVAPQTHRLLRFRMARAHDEAWGGMVQVARQLPGVLDAVRAEVAARGPLTAAEIERALAPPARRDRSNWGWNWSDTKRAVEFLFWSGEISSAGRTTQFERRYDLTSRVLPPDVASAPDPDPEDAARELVRIAAGACGVATERGLRDYFRLKPEQARPAVADLVETGALVPVEVEGWARTGYLAVAARRPRWIRARALLSPFDSLIWERERTEELFGFRYRIEIYTPVHRRVHGYYVLPFLLGDELVARVDLKADRAPAGSGLLQVRSAWAEDHIPPGSPHQADVAAELAAELALTAEWLGLDGVSVEPRGDLAAALAAAVARDDRPL